MRVSEIVRVVLESTEVLQVVSTVAVVPVVAVMIATPMKGLSGMSEHRMQTGEDRVATLQ